MYTVLLLCQKLKNKESRGICNENLLACDTYMNINNKNAKFAIDVMKYLIYKIYVQELGKFSNITGNMFHYMYNINSCS